MSSDPGRSVREGILYERLGTHFNAVSRNSGRDVPTLANDDWIDKVLMEVVYILHDTVLKRSADV
jgi:hypothetical protein